MAKPNLFNSVKMTRPKRSAFDLSHDVKLSFNMGELVPVCCFEAVPGDSFNMSMESLIRFAPMVAPVMHRFDVTCHYFFVPNRIIWPGWSDFIMNQNNEGQAGVGNVPAFPFIDFDPTAFDGTYERLGNYLGLPYAPTTGVTPEKVSALPFAAYQKIWFDYYRDQNLFVGAFDELDDGDNNAAFNSFLGVLRKRCWEHDYFTAALPFAQKGAGVTIPIAGFEDVPVGIDAGTTIGSQQWPMVTPPVNANVLNDDDPDNIVPSQYLLAKTSNLDAQAATINDLRRAFRLQEWLEKNARGGTRYIENILAHFGVRSSDKRLQRPEYITGVKSPVVISEVLQTGESGTTPQGNMSGHGVGVTSGRYGKYFCEEHGYIIGIMSVMPKTAYQQGIPRHFLKYNDMLDYYWPTFAHLGEQEVLGKEVYAYEPAAYGDAPFGYVPRYAEYKFLPNRVAGEFALTLDYWHAGRIFANPPSLNNAFVESDPTHRIFAVTDPTEDKLFAHVLNKIRAIRPMPKFGTPTF